MSSIPIKRALIAVYDKTGVADFARSLVDEFGVEIISTGGTAKHLKEAGIPVTMVEAVTGFPELLDGRVKTLHPKIHAGILADRDNPEHMRQLREHGIEPIDMVVVNLYPFEETIRDPNCRFEDAIEMIDIGGPCMLRAAAKNHRHVLVVVNQHKYNEVLGFLRSGSLDTKERMKYAAGVFGVMRAYETRIFNYLLWQQSNPVEEPVAPETELVAIDVMVNIKRESLRYGENPHQRAAIYDPETLPNATEWLENWQIAAGMSYNNYVDADAALALCAELHRGICIAAQPQPTREPRASARAVLVPPAAFDVESAFERPDPAQPVWLLTWTTYGSWLPGDARGYVSRSPREAGDHTLQNAPGTPYDVDQDDLENAARERMSGEPIRLSQAQAEAAFAAMCDAAARHQIAIQAISLMPDHVHVLCQSTKDGSELLQLFKGNSSHQLSKQYKLSDGSRWWTKSGSKRVIRAGEDLSAAIAYVVNQRGALVVRGFEDALEAEATGGIEAARAEARGSSSTCVFIKHTNACGVGVAVDPIEAYRRAYLGDPNAAMGGILAVDFHVDETFAEAVMATLQRFKADAEANGCANPPQAFFAEVIVAPSFDEKAVDVIRTRKQWGERVRLLAVGDMSQSPSESDYDYKRIAGGMLIQTPDLLGLNESDWRVATDREPTAQEMADLRLAWLVCKHTKSNAITLCKDGMLIGNGAGQMSRVMSCRIATWLAKENGHADKLAGSVAASDAFFPFRDGPDFLIDAGITAIIHPGGSKRDDEVIAAANERGIAMILTGTRHFKH